MSRVPPFVSNAYLKTADAVLTELTTSKKKGLSSREAQERLRMHGLNALPDAKKHRWITLLLDRLRDTLVLILLAAAAFSVVVGEKTDAIIILLAIAIDVILSVAQTWRTERTLEGMKEQIKDTISVIRDSKVTTIKTEKLAIGDIFQIRAGKHVPADARIVTAMSLRTQEAALTGEAADISKEAASFSTKTPIASQKNMLFAGTSVVDGSGIAVVTATGVHTEFGKIANMIREQQSPNSPLRKILQKTGVRIGWAIIGAVLILAIISLFQGESLAEAARIAVTLIVSAIPEDLTMILTIAMTIGVVRILKQGGVMKKLSSGETLGAATVICTDKTGTLTEGKMEAIGIDFMQGDFLQPETPTKEFYHQLTLTGLALANDAYRLPTDQDQPKPRPITAYFGSTTERTAIAFAENTGLDKKKLQQQWRVRDMIPFSPEWKYRANLFDHPTQHTKYLLITGAPDVLLDKSSHALTSANEAAPINATRRAELEQRITHLAGQGQRLLAIAVHRDFKKTEITKKDVANLTFLGVLVIKDPVRKDVLAAIQETYSAGVEIKLITGDHAATAQAIAQQVGISSSRDSVCTGDEIQAMDDKELSDVIGRLNIFARVEPLDKQRIIRILQEQGHVVAMTGDGINDAVALKGADIGVAMGSGSDIAKDAADLILLNNSFATIVAAIKEGRVIRDNIRKVITFLLSTNMAEVAIFFVSIILGLPLPLLPAQILWINLVTDGTSDIALSLEPAEKSVMRRGPDSTEESFINKQRVREIVFSGIIMTIGTMSLFWYLLEYLSLDLAYARTMAFTFLAIASLLSTWSFRSLSISMLRPSHKKNIWMFVSAGFSFSLHLVAIYVPGISAFFGTTPLGAMDWVLIILGAVAVVFIMDARKQLFKERRVKQFKAAYSA